MIRAARLRERGAILIALPALQRARAMRGAKSSARCRRASAPCAAMLRAAPCHYYALRAARAASACHDAMMRTMPRFCRARAPFSPPPPRRAHATFYYNIVCWLCRERYAKTPYAEQRSAAALFSRDGACRFMRCCARARRARDGSARRADAMIFILIKTRGYFAMFLCARDATPPPPLYAVLSMRFFSAHGTPFHAMRAKSILRRFLPADIYAWQQVFAFSSGGARSAFFMAALFSPLLLLRQRALMPSSAAPARAPARHYCAFRARCAHTRARALCDGAARGGR